ncbi:hypothetical protein [Xanthomonas campestris]|uniref:hypothetical protein n=1 Tax=Xanthomonas campestris TaxID=339 RepID=UPI00111586B2|nr:hypothetical protein [Xanthomonas campestris]WVL61785.1 hypothetical protein LLE68_005170 [Xanthomonas campestris pv. barbareae]
MLIPNAKDACNYFESIGLKLNHLSNAPTNGNFCNRWWLSCHEGTAWGRDHLCFLDLWCEWLCFTAHALNQEQASIRFLADYKEANEELRNEMKTWIDRYRNHESPTELYGYFFGEDAVTPDSLPRSWKAKIRKQLRQDKNGARFYDEIKKHL